MHIIQSHALHVETSLCACIVDAPVNGLLKPESRLLENLNRSFQDNIYLHWCYVLGSIYSIISMFISVLRSSFFSTPSNNLLFFFRKKI